MMERKLDCKGLACPEPVIRCRALLTENPQTVEVLVDNPSALENVSRFLERNGYETTSSQLCANEWRIHAHNINAAAPISKATPNKATSGKTLVLLTTETIGRGDDGLGAKLMATFLANLPELGDSLWRIILLNGAVRLSAQDGEALKQLKTLESNGVSILVCGTCLTHYGLLEKKQVGVTTNMMDVISSMAFAQKVIRP